MSFGGGVNSTAMLVYLIEKNKPIDVVIFANTRNEFEHTYESVAFYKKYTEDNGIKFVEVDSNIKYGTKDMYEYYYNKKITPSRMKRDCTTKFKISPIRKYLRKNYPKEKFIMYIGIDFGEMHRMKDSNVKYITNNYPLVEAKIDRDTCEELLKMRNLPVPDKSGCWYCPFTKKQGWIDLRDNEPKLFERAIELEKNNKRYPEAVSLLSSKRLELLSKNKNTKLEDFDPTCDVSGGCFL